MYMNTNAHFPKIKNGYRTLALKYLELYFNGIFDISTDTFMSCYCNKRVQSTTHTERYWTLSL